MDYIRLDTWHGLMGLNSGKNTLLNKHSQAVTGREAGQPPEANRVTSAGGVNRRSSSSRGGSDSKRSQDGRGGLAAEGGWGLLRSRQRSSCFVPVL